ncbi:hypothetical protein PFICI_09709 [Pestalotiopsis fici W106-1]|uniref:Uncharacterized protein n=1 Tax=Pestalotiopsis fici (strain W106-1 / CGMCC3.15140) TaxID=1229662 RepID=W3WWZ4_PESFW|nr:uncharacterized protein PFICI_09709 [Pestalotiopsis fici W106-1]ETS77647.1 hypothetical protein PFICI_09709 [Pestalotiopsis fici W106-1]
MPIPSSSNPQEPQALGPRNMRPAAAAAGAQTSEEAAGRGADQPTGAGVNTGAGTTREKTEAEKEADRLYEEAMEDEYAKREGGA